MMIYGFVSHCLSYSTLIKVSGIEEESLRILFHDGVLEAGYPGHTSVTVSVVLGSAPRGVHADLLEVSVDVIDVDYREL